MFAQSSSYYDAIFAKKDYAGEVSKLANIIRSNLQRPARSLLDVACGTGRHLEHFAPWMEVEGIDLNEELLRLARKRLPHVRFHSGDMRNFDLGREFDVVTCLFSAITYVQTADALSQAIVSMARHVVPNGLLIIEPWWSPEKWVVDHKARALFVDEPDLKLVRMALSGRDGDLGTVELHFLVGSDEGIQSFTELHRFALFTGEQMRAAFEGAGLQMSYDPVGPCGRGVYVGSKSDL
jgi:ubiquinone/menaquinone biosynthesis C-methylase UbiE